MAFEQVACGIVGEGEGAAVGKGLLDEAVEAVISKEGGAPQFIGGADEISDDVITRNGACAVRVPNEDGFALQIGESGGVGTGQSLDADHGLMIRGVHVGS